MPRSETGPRPTSVLALVLVCAAVTLVVFPGLVTELSTRAAAWGGFACLAALGAAGYVWSRRSGENPWLSPAFIYVAYVFVFQYGVGLLFLEHSDAIARYLDADAAGLADARSGLPRAVWLILIGALATQAALFVRLDRFTRLLPRLEWEEDPRRFARLAVVAIPVLLAASAYAVREDVPASIQQVIYIIGAFGTVLMVCGFFRLVRRDAHAALWRPVVFTCMLGYLGVGFFFGSRGVWMFVLVFFMWSIAAVRGRVTRKMILSAAVLLVVYAWILFPWLTTYKYYRTCCDLSTTDAYALATEEYPQHFGDLGLGGPLQVLQSLTFQATYVASYQQVYPSPFPYLGGESALVTLEALVPRAMNPNKVNVTDYVQFLAYRAGLYTEASYSAETRSAISIDQVSEFYINFGPWGVLVLSFVQGLYLRGRYEWLIQRSRLALGFPIYAVGFLAANAFWGLFLLDIKNWIVWGFMLWLLSRKR